MRALAQLAARNSLPGEIAGALFTCPGAVVVQATRRIMPVLTRCVKGLKETLAPTQPAFLVALVLRPLEASFPALRTVPSAPQDVNPAFGGLGNLASRVTEGITCNVTAILVNFNNHAVFKQFRDRLPLRVCRVGTPGAAVLVAHS